MPYYVELQFANKTERMTFDSKLAASNYALDLKEMFNASDLDLRDNTYFVDATHIRIAK